MEVHIDCPVCASGNHFRIDGTVQELACEDCGYLLSPQSSAELGDLDRCLFCGGDSFYFESPFSLPFLGRDSVCYVCGARYMKTVVGNPDAKYDSDKEEIAQQSSYAEALRGRAENYPNNLGSAAAEEVKRSKT